jgi:adenosylcobyric acid synthase
LDLETSLTATKRLGRVEGRLALEDAPVCGYEIHMGISRGPALERPAVYLRNTADGALSADGQVLGTYLHGLFDAAPARDALLRWAGLEVARTPDYRTLREAGIDRLADTLEACLDLRSLEKMLEG